MSVNPVFSELALKSGKTLKSQSIVESRIAEKDTDVVKILAVHSNASLIGSETMAGEVRYSGRVVFSLVYENFEGNIIRSEYGVEFSHKAEREDILPSMTASCRIITENTELKQLNGSYVLSAIASASIDLVFEENYEYLSAGEGIVCRSREMQICRRLSSEKGGYELFEELETVAVENVIMHYEDIVITNAQAGVGCVILDAAVNLNIVYLTAGENKRVETVSKLSEFRFEIESDDAMPSMPVTAAASVRGASISVAVDESKNRSVISAEVGIDAVADIFETLAVNAVSDVYSTTNDITVNAESIKSQKPLSSVLYDQTYSDAAIVSGSLDFSNDIMGITAESVSIQTTRVEDGSFTAEGVVSALALIKDAEGKVSSVSMELPFLTELEMDGVTAGSSISVDALAYNINAKQKKEGEIEMSASLKIFATAYDYDYLTVITAVEEGDEIIKNQSAISVYIPEKNDELWDVAKRLNEPPEEILKNNTHLEFPLNGDEKIIFYRQERIDY